MNPRPFKAGRVKSKKAFNEIKKLHKALPSRVKAIITLDEIDSSYYTDDDDECRASKMFGSVYLHVENHIDEFESPKVGDKYYYEHCNAPYQIIKVGSLKEFIDRERCRYGNPITEKEEQEDIESLKSEGVTRWISLKLIPMDDDDFDEDEDDDSLWKLLLK